MGTGAEAFTFLLAPLADSPALGLLPPPVAAVLSGKVLLLEILRLPEPEPESNLQTEGA